MNEMSNEQANITVLSDVSASNIVTAAGTTLSVEEEIYRLASETKNVREINLQRSEVGWFQNSRNQSLHFRMYYKHNEPIKAVIFYLHGYAGRDQEHCTSP